MALWRWTPPPKPHWVKCPWHKQGKWPRPARAVIYGSGQSLISAPVPEDAFRIVFNRAWQVVEPHLWVGLDRPAIFDSPNGHLSATTFPKVYRGFFSSYPALPGDSTQLARDIPCAHFADTATGDRDEIFANHGLDQTFLWTENTMHFAIQIALWMGFRDLAFAGIDLHGRYFSREIQQRLTLRQIKASNQLLVEEFRWFKRFIPEANRRGIRISCLSPGSKLMELL